MHAIIWWSINVALLPASLVVAAQGAAANDGASNNSADAPTASSPLVAEIKSWESRDMRADPDGSVAALFELRDRAETAPDLPIEAKADLTTLIGVAYFSGQKYAESAQWMAKAAAIWETVDGREDKQAEMLNNRATILRALKRLSEAEAVMGQALAIRIHLYGAEDETVASSTYGLANILYSQGRFEEALPLMREATRQQKIFTPDRPELVIQRLTGLGSILNDSGRDAEAISVMREAEQFARETLGKDHQTYGTLLHNFGLNLADVGLHGQALPMLRQAVDIRRQTNGADSPWTAASLSALATSLQAAGNLDEAATLHERALEIMQAKRDVVGAESIARVLSQRSNVAAAQHDWSDFDRWIGEAIVVVDDELAEVHPMRSSVHLLQAQMLEQRGRFAEALPIAEKWVAVQSDTLIPEHRSRILGELLLARLRQAAGELADRYWPTADAAIDRLQVKLTDLTSSERQRASEAQANRSASVLYLQMALAEEDANRAILAAQLANISDLSVGQEQTQAFDGNVPDNAGPDLIHGKLIAATRLETQRTQRLAALLDTQDEAAIAAAAAQVDEASAARLAIQNSVERAFPTVARAVPPFTCRAFRYRRCTGRR